MRSMMQESMPSRNPALASMEEILAEARQGKMFILVDDEDRENEGDLIIPAKLAEADHINFMAKHGRGLICLAMDSQSIQRLGLGLMPRSNTSRFDTAFTVSIEAKLGVTTGISAADRAQTIKVACNPTSSSHDIVTPGHIFPLAAKDGGVLMRAGHTEAAVDIARLSGFGTSGVICEIMNDQGEMMRLLELIPYAKHHGMKIGTIADLIAYRRRHDHLLKCTAQCEMEIKGAGKFNLKVYQNEVDGTEHIALIKGRVEQEKATIVRMHAFNTISDLFEKGGESSIIHQALQEMERLGSGVFVLIREANLDSLSKWVANYIQPVSGDQDSDSKPSLSSNNLRDYGVGAQILLDIGVSKMILMSNQQRHIVGLEGYGLRVEGWVPLKSL